MVHACSLGKVGNNDCTSACSPRVSSTVARSSWPGLSVTATSCLPLQPSPASCLLIPRDLLLTFLSYIKTQRWLVCCGPKSQVPAWRISPFIAGISSRETYIFGCLPLRRIISPYGTILRDCWSCTVDFSVIFLVMRGLTWSSWVSWCSIPMIRSCFSGVGCILFISGVEFLWFCWSLQAIVKESGWWSWLGWFCPTCCLFIGSCILFIELVPLFWSRLHLFCW